MNNTSVARGKHHHRVTGRDHGDSCSRPVSNISARKTTTLVIALFQRTLADLQISYDSKTTPTSSAVLIP
ncbi:hypothetical protein J6590_037619 [Homalodisca vitripennis]|nr:hypothetical protein J6590_037619 [Homalodisca vitripennis]